MEVQDIIRTTPANRYGYIPRSIGESNLKIEDLNIYRKLREVRNAKKIFRAIILYAGIIGLLVFYSAIR